MKPFDFLIKSLPWLVMFWLLSGTYFEHEKHEEKMRIEESKIPPIDNKITKAKQNVAEIEVVKKNIVEYKGRIENFKQQIEDIKIQIPPIAKKTQILEEFSQVARSLNIKNPIFRPKYLQEKSNGVYLSNGIEFEATGTYLQFLILFERLAEAKRVLNVASVKVRNDVRESIGRHNIVKVSAIIESFHYNDINKITVPEEEKKKKR